MKIGILGWGSLIWDQRDLQTTGRWESDGPQLPIEFARVSKNGRLTLVIKPDFDLVPVLWIKSGLDDLQMAIKDLMTREDTTNKSDIGFVNFTYGRNSIRRSSDSILAELKKWNTEKKLDAVIWTDLGPNFWDKTGKQFTAENLVTYLAGLQKKSPETYTLAKQYILNTPEQIQTRYRPELQKFLLTTTK